MKLTRRQLRKIINEAITLNEQSGALLGLGAGTAETLAGNLPPEERKDIIDQIDWVRCGLPDGANWNKYTQKTYKVSERNRSNPTVANEQFVGCITVPLRWTILSETADHLLTKFKINVSPGARHDLDRDTSRYGYSADFRRFTSLEVDRELLQQALSYGTPKYSAFEEYYIKLAQGTKIHAKEFNETFLNNFIDLLREALKTSYYSTLASRTDDHEEILRQIRAAFIRMENDKAIEYLKCVSHIDHAEDLYDK